MISAAAKPWFLYALGGGWGHLNRMLALARIASKSRKIILLTNARNAERIAASEPETDLLVLRQGTDVAEMRRKIRDAICGTTAGCLIVDTFPRGLGGELAGLLKELAIPKVLVHRCLTPAYGTPELREFISQNYDLVLTPRDFVVPNFADLPSAVPTEPWLIRSAAELPSRAQARRVLRVEQECRVFGICAAPSNEVEARWYGAAGLALRESFPDAAVRWITPVRLPECTEIEWIPHWPAMECLPGLDLLVCGGGYNTLHEAGALGIRCAARTWPRLYDMQAERIAGAAREGNAIPVVNVSDVINAAGDGARVPHFEAYVNGVEAALEALMEICSSTPSRRFAGSSPLSAAHLD